VNPHNTRRMGFRVFRKRSPGPGPRFPCARIRESILSGRDYPGKAEDLELVRRKQRELGSERLRRLVGYGQEGTAKGRGGGYGN
jgi:hypothetical protein